MCTRRPLSVGIESDLVAMEMAELQQRGTKTTDHGYECGLMAYWMVFGAPTEARRWVDGWIEAVGGIR